MSLRAHARLSFDVRQPKRDLQSVTLPTCLGAGRAVRKGDTGLPVRQNAHVVSLAGAFEELILEGVPFSDCERVSQALPPRELKINLCTCGPTTSTRTPAIEKVVQVIAQQSAEGNRSASCWCRLRSG